MCLYGLRLVLGECFCACECVYVSVVRVLVFVSVFYIQLLRWQKVNWYFTSGSFLLYSRRRHIVIAFQLYTCFIGMLVIKVNGDVIKFKWHTQHIFHGILWGWNLNSFILYHMHESISYFNANKNRSRKKKHSNAVFMAMNFSSMC